MTEQTVHPTSSTTSTAQIVYLLYFVGIFVPLLSIIGVIVAYMADKNNPVAISHLKFQIRTFWWSILLGLVGFLTLFFVVGGFVLLWALIFVILRNVTGYMLLKENRAVVGVKTVGLVAI